MKPLPLPVRIAAGLVATAVEQARDLPRQVAEFPVTAVSQALQASMRVQQKVTELAIKGDQALDTLRPIEDQPEWATFDDEEPVSGNGASTVTELRPQAGPGADAVPDVDVDVDVVDDWADDGAPADVDAAGAPTHVAAPVATPATAPGDADARTDQRSDGPPALPGYAELTIPQLRGKLRRLSVDDLRALLAWETSHDNRAPFVTMLANRITTVTEG
jgi:hypothetical protein